MKKPKKNITPQNKKEKKKQKQKPFPLRLDEHLEKPLEDSAVKNRRSVNGQINFILEKELINT